MWQNENCSNLALVVFKFYLLSILKSWHGELPSIQSSFAVQVRPWNILRTMEYFSEIENMVILITCTLSPAPPTCKGRLSPMPAEPPAEKGSSRSSKICIFTSKIWPLIGFFSIGIGDTRTWLTLLAGGPLRGRRPPPPSYVGFFLTSLLRTLQKYYHTVGWRQNADWYVSSVQAIVRKARSTYWNHYAGLRHTCPLDSLFLKPLWLK